MIHCYKCNQKFENKHNSVHCPNCGEGFVETVMPDARQSLIAAEIKLAAKTSSKASVSTADRSTISPNTPGATPHDREQLLEGLSPSEAIEKYESELTPFEKSELNKF